VHSKGLKFGLYQDWGEKTCGGYPGVLGNEEKDAKQFAEWEVDYVKLDGCYSDVRDMDRGKIDYIHVTYIYIPMSLKLIQFSDSYLAL